MPLVTADDLRTLLGRPLTDAQCTLAATLTEDAIRGEVGDRLTDPPQPGVSSVALAVAARVLTNPGGVRSEQAGGMLISYADAQTGVVLSDDERRRLRRAVGLASGAGMLDISPAEPGPTVCVRRPW
ncbi:hypothetical protein GCM10009548_01730 [Streptomyces malaysiensis subsp. malaysiensis]|uniref:Uncharacterized protein n=1 Tax=Streptomyces malaysiensis TaxID=92644 RepID=A0ABX6W6T7_STRMQ|nr:MULTISPECIES: hypothetical protein [Streptomyces]QPI56360.1 hypothetical protein I1A49_16675 [Streptomyces solisilvae]UHH17847.1 hypothetical protein LUV23_16790 [Streptomyces sp. HNM0561]